MIFITHQIYLSILQPVQTLSKKTLGVKCDSKQHFHAQVDYIFSQSLRILGSVRTITYYMRIFSLIFVLWHCVGSVQYVVSLLFAAICYFIYSYVAVCMFCAVRCAIIICCYLLFYLQLCSCKYVLCSTLCHYYLLLSVILFSYVAVCMFCAVRCVIIIIICLYLLFYLQ